MKIRCGSFVPAGGHRELHCAVELLREQTPRAARPRTSLRHRGRPRLHTHLDAFACASGRSASSCERARVAPCGRVLEILVRRACRRSGASSDRESRRRFFAHARLLREMWGASELAAIRHKHAALLVHLSAPKVFPANPPPLRALRSIAHAAPGRVRCCHPRRSPSSRRRSR